MLLSMMGVTKATCLLIYKINYYLLLQNRKDIRIKDDPGPV